MSNTNPYNSLDRYNTVHNTTFNTFKSEEPIRHSLPANNRYTRRSLKSRSKSRETKPRPKPLQVENEKYYDHIFPVQYLSQQTKNTNASNYYQPNTLDQEEL